jgi:hypothetical protein
MQHLKYNIIPQSLWTKRLGYTMHIAPDGSRLQLRREGGLPIEFARDNSRGSNFMCVHNNNLRWSPEGPVTPPPKLVSVSVYSAEGSAAVPNAAAVFNEEYSTAAQRQRAPKTAQLHSQIGHPSDAVLTEELDTVVPGQCAPKTAQLHSQFGHPSDAVLTEELDTVDPGQLMHCDLVYWFGRTYLLCVDDATGYVYLQTIKSKRTNDMMIGFNKVINSLRASRRATVRAYGR